MSPYNPGASTAGTSGAPTPDTQTVIGLLGSLMPLLLQIQLQSREQMFQPGLMHSGSYQPSSAHSVPGQQNLDPSGVGSLFGNNLLPPNAMLDHRAAVDLVEDLTADSLRTLSNYLETYAGRHQGLESCIPIVTQAARCFAARDYALTLGLIWQAYRLITALRIGNPQLPPLRAASSAGAPLPSATTIIH